MEPLIFSQSVAGRRGVTIPAPDVPVRPLADLLPPEALCADPPPLPEVSELEVVRHFTRLSQRNFSIDTVMYPLGSCTMKYNPKVNDALAALPGFSQIHPHQDPEEVQGALQLMVELEQCLCEMTGMARFSLQPAAGAHGEFTALLMAHKYFKDRGEDRDVVLVPDSAHGTNPASAAMCGLRVQQVRTDDHGNVDLADLSRHLNDRVAVLMLTNPSTLGLFEAGILEIAGMVHEAGGLLYYDGANANATLGRVRPGDMGFDLLHLNLHKTFSTPHGGGGPGAGPVGATAALAPYLPVPRVGWDESSRRYVVQRDDPQSIGRVRSFFGNFLVLVRAYAYIRAQGAAGLAEVSECAVLNANYLMARLRDSYDVAYPRLCQHEFVLSARRQKANGVRALDIGKRLLDYGVHAPTVYFPLVVEEAMMIEPTETESKPTLDKFVEIMDIIARESVETPDLVRGAPYTTPVSRLDEAAAARRPVLADLPGVSC